MSWTEVQLKEVAISYSGGTPRRDKKEYFGGNIPWISSSEVNQSYIQQTKESITELGLASSSAKWITPNAVLIALYGATAGQVSKLLIKATSNQAVLAIICNEMKLDSDFLYYQLKFQKEKILYKAQGSGQPNLSKELIDNLWIPLPEKKEQTKIAAVLKTVDEAIEQTEILIAKYQKIKVGLMQDLLTKGIDAKGNIRNTTTHKFVVKHGMQVPVEWEVGFYEMFCEKISVGIATSSSDYFADDGTLFLRNQNIKENSILLEDVVFITKEFADLNRTKYLKPGDIVTVRTGYPGMSAVVPDELENAQTFTTLISRPRKSVAISQYLCYYINSDSGKRQVKNLQGGGAQQNLNAGALSKLIVALPKKEEQDRILQTINSKEELIRNENDYLQKLLSLKVGLMQEMLSGKVRVNINEYANTN